MARIRNGEGAHLMRMLKSAAAALLALTVSGVLSLLLVAPASAQASPCPPGQPTGRPPGTPPNQPGPPEGRPPEYPPGRCNLALSQSAGSRGQSVDAQGNGFVPGESVVFSLGNRQVASSVANPSGVVSTSFTVPDDAPFGRTEVRASGQAQVLSAAFEVLPGAASADRSSRATAAAGSVARTGAYVGATALAGAALVGLGTVFVLGARRRRGLPAT